MSTRTTVKYIIDAIHSVRSRVRTAAKQGDLQEAHRLMGDLYSLEVLLVSESAKLIRELEALEAA